MNPPAVHIVILNWNSIDETAECLQTIKDLTYSNVQIQLVDNASDNNEGARLEELFPDVHVIKNSENLGFTGGCNIGIIAAIESGADFVMLLNNDTLVPPDLIEQLLGSQAKLDDVGAISPVIFKYPETDTVWFSEAKWQTNWRTGETGFRLTSNETYTELKQRGSYVSEFACGCCLLVSRDVIAKVGFFDDRYFAFYDEADLCARMRKHGLKSYVVPSAHIYHKVGGSTPNLIMTYLLTRNRLLWMKENLPLADRLKAAPAMAREFIWHAFNFCKLLPPKSRYFSRRQSLAFLIGYKDYLFGRFGKVNDKLAKNTVDPRNAWKPQ